MAFTAVNASYPLILLQFDILIFDRPLLVQQVFSLLLKLII